LEIKAVAGRHPIHEAQVLTYLKLDKKSLGLLINFNVPMLKQGIKSVACGDLFKEETGGRGFASQIFSLLCASVSLWFKWLKSNETEGISGANVQGSENLPGAACFLARQGVAKRRVALRLRGEGMGKGRGGADLS